MTVIYVDSVFVLNGLIDYLLLVTTARLAGVPLRRNRYIVAALLGACYAVAVFFPGCRFLASPAVKAAAGVLLALIAFGREEKLLRLIFLMALISCGFAGCILGLSFLADTYIPVVDGIFYTDVDGKALLIGAAAAYAVLTFVFRAAAQPGIEGRILPVRVAIRGQVMELTALWDTGNTLREPMRGRSVLVISAGSLDAVLPSSLRQFLTAKKLRDPAGALEQLQRSGEAQGFQLLPYRAVGITSGLLLAMRSDWVEILGQRYDGLLVAMAPSVGGTGYAALWGGQVGRRGKREDSNRHTEFVDPSGAATES